MRIKCILKKLALLASHISMNLKWTNEELVHALSAYIELWMQHERSVRVAEKRPCLALLGVSGIRDNWQNNFRDKG